MPPSKTTPSRQQPNGGKRRGPRRNQRTSPDGERPILAPEAKNRIPEPPLPTVAPRRLQGTPELLTALGHAPGCIDLSRQGSISSCDCSLAPLEDPAIVIGMVVLFVRTSRAARTPLPDLIVELLFRQLLQRDAACWVIADWLVDLGLLDTRNLPKVRRPR